MILELTNDIATLEVIRAHYPNDVSIQAYCRNLQILLTAKLTGTINYAGKLVDEEAKLIRNNPIHNKITVIKMVRRRTGLSLLESKFLVETEMKEMGLVFD